MCIHNKVNLKDIKIGHILEQTMHDNLIPFCVLCVDFCTFVLSKGAKGNKFDQFILVLGKLSV